MTMEEYQDHDCKASQDSGCTVCYQAIEQGLIQERIEPDGWDEPDYTYASDANITKY